MLVRHAMSLGLTPEQMKAWSQNLGPRRRADHLHELRTGADTRQGEIIRGMEGRREAALMGADPVVMMEAVLACMKALK
jgi:hypothetical protein